MSRLAACLLALMLAAGCGDTRETREPDVVVRESTPAGETPARGGGDDVRLWVVTHGQASSAFWTIVRNGIEAARRQMAVDVTYRSPDVYDVDAMRELIAQAVASEPDGLVVSIPSPELEGPIRAAVRAGIPVVSTPEATSRAARAPSPTSASRRSRQASRRDSGWWRRARTTPCASTTRSATRRSIAAAPGSRAPCARPVAARA